MKKLMIVAVAALLGLSWWTTFSSAVQKPAEYQSYLAEAQKNEKKGIYYDAILNYQKALEYHPENMDIYLKIAEAYKNLGDENGFIQACTQAMNLEGDGEQAVMILADYYLERRRHCAFAGTDPAAGIQWLSQGKAELACRRI